MKAIADTCGGHFHVAIEPKDTVKPCPFCGSRDIELANTWTPSYWAECKVCGVQVRSPNRKDWKRSDVANPKKHLASARLALQAWNARVSATPAVTGAQK